MANYEAVARSNYVRFRDVAEVNALLARIAAGAELTEEQDGRHALLCCDGLPRDVQDDDTGEDLGDFPFLVAALMQPGEVIVWMDTGHEKMRYVSGYGLAINADGDSRFINLEEIEDKAKELAPAGTEITSPAY